MLCAIGASFVFHVLTRQLVFGDRSWNYLYAEPEIAESQNNGILSKPQSENDSAR